MTSDEEVSHRPDLHRTRSPSGWRTTSGQRNRGKPVTRAFTEDVRGDVHGTIVRAHANGLLTVG
jgi:hypothetical protein